MFHWEIADAQIAGNHRPLDLVAIERRVDAVIDEYPGHTISSIWSSAGAADRFDVYVDSDVPGESRIVRIDGEGSVLNIRSENDGLSNGGWVDTLVGIHHDLLGGSFGGWIVGISGLLLVSNLLMGLWLARPRMSRWRRSLWPSNKGPVAAQRYSRHRAIGLWAVIPALCVVSAGTMLVFENGIETLIVSPEPESEVAFPDGPNTIGMATAANTALATYPGAALTAINFPTADIPAYDIRLRQAGEWRRAYGKTSLLISAADGRILSGFDALHDPAGRNFVDGLFPFHTGEMGGTIGRIAVMAVGLWLIVMVILGLLLWKARGRVARNVQ